MKKFFFLALMAFLWLPATTWADTSDHTGDPDENSGQLENGDIWDDEQEGTGDDLGKVVPSSVQLEYQILTAPQGDINDEDYVNGTVELEGIYGILGDATTVGALYIPHEIQVVTVEGTNATVSLYDVVGIAADAFRSGYGTYNNTVTSVSIPYTVEYIGDRCFWSNTSLTAVTLVEGLETIGQQAFRSCSALTAIDIPEGVTNIDYYTFGFCSAMASVTLPTTLTSIGESAFYNCSRLTEVIIPAGVNSYGVDAFANCSSLKTVVLLDNDPSDVTIAGSASSNNDVFNNDTGITFYVPQGSEVAYLNSAWEDEVETDLDSWNFFSIDIAETYTDGTSYYATYYMDEADYELSDVTLYAITSAENGEATMEALTGDIIPAGTPLLIESSVTGTDYFWKDYYGADGDQAGYLSGTTPTTISVPENNMLYGHSEQAYTCAANGEYDASKVDGYLYYKLSLKSSSDLTSVGFYYGAANGASYEASAHKCWLAVPTESSSADGISLKKGDSDDTTGISAIESASEKTVSGIYTIQGVRVSNMNQPGLYIVDGKKVLVK